MSHQPRGWYSRRFLPHFDAGSHRYQFLTYRLADSLPAGVGSAVDAELREVPAGDRPRERFRRLESKLDSGLGSCLLAIERNAESVIETWERFADERYDLVAWVVMPNHVHVLIRPFDAVSLSTIVQS